MFRGKKPSNSLVTFVMGRVGKSSVISVTYLKPQDRMIMPIEVTDKGNYEISPSAVAFLKEQCKLELRLNNYRFSLNPRTVLAF